MHEWQIWIFLLMGRGGTSCWCIQGGRGFARQLEQFGKAFIAQAQDGGHQGQHHQHCQELPEGLTAAAVTALAFARLTGNEWCPQLSCP